MYFDQIDLKIKKARKKCNRIMHLVKIKYFKNILYFVIINFNFQSTDLHLYMMIRTSNQSYIDWQNQDEF